MLLRLLCCLKISAPVVNWSTETTKSGWRWCNHRHHVVLVDLNVLKVLRTELKMFQFGGDKCGVQPKQQWGQWGAVNSHCSWLFPMTILIGGGGNMVHVQPKQLSDKLWPNFEQIVTKLHNPNNKVTNCDQIVQPKQQIVTKLVVQSQPRCSISPPPEEKSFQLSALLPPQFPPFLGGNNWKLE